jgi:prepilin-type N-terminal cleavage/methylation domain-containing protein
LKQGFTLIELAIVVVVLGILIIGVVGAQSIMESAEKRAFVTEMQGYYMALKAFELEFDAIPGDFDEAEDYWGSNCNGKINNCNGDGNGTLRPWPRDSFRFWVHLEEAGLIEERRGSGDTAIYRRMEYFRKNSNSAIYSYTGAFSPWLSDLIPNHKLQITFSRQVGGGIDNSVLKAEESHYIDKKMDDGIRTTGIVVSTRGDNNDGDCRDGRNYNLSSDGINCITAFIMD